MEDNFKFVGCNEDDAISCGSAMFKIHKLKEKLKTLFSNVKLGEELTNLFKSENLSINISSTTIEHRGKNGSISGRLGTILYQKWFDEGINTM